MKSIDINLSAWKQFKKLMMQELLKYGIVPERFTGYLTIHCNDGEICEMDRVEKNILKRLKVSLVNCQD